MNVVVINMNTSLLLLLVFCVAVVQASPIPEAKEGKKSSMDLSYSANAL